MKLKHFLSGIAMFVILFSAYSCSKSSSNTQPPPSGTGNPASVDIYQMTFPGDITVKKGTTVTWNNKDNFAHTVTSDDGSTFNSGNLAGGASFSYVTTTAGTFTYHCNIHSNMHGTLVVTP